MKYPFLLIIKLYWVLVPASKRRRCIFHKSCSNYVYETTKKHGLFKGSKAFIYRFQNCRSGFEVFKNPIDGQLTMLLPNREIIQQDEISTTIKKHYL